MRNVIFLMLCVIGLVFLFSPKSYASETPSVLSEQMVNKEKLPKADEIVTVYRVSHGKVQYRRWNATQGYWVDDNWINL